MDASTTNSSSDPGTTYWMTQPTPEQRHAADWAEVAERKRRAMDRLSPPYAAGTTDEEPITISDDAWRAVMEDPDTLQAVQGKFAELQQASEERLRQAAEALTRPASTDPSAHQRPGPSDHAAAHPSAQQPPSPVMPPQHGPRR